MKYSILFMFLLVPFISNGQYMEFEPIEGDTGTSDTQTSPTRVQTQTEGDVEYGWKVEEGESAASGGGEQGGTEDINIGVGELRGVEPDEIDVSATGEAERKGNVETEWKVEEGESMTGEEPKDVSTRPQETMTNFGVLLGGGDDDDDGDGRESRSEVARILLAGMQEADEVPVEEFSLNYEEIKMTVVEDLKLLGVIPVKARAEVRVDAEQNVDVKFPWWAILASGKDSDGLGSRALEALTNAFAAQYSSILEVYAGVE